MNTVNRRTFLKNSLAVAISSSMIATGGAAIATGFTDDRLKAYLQGSDNTVAGISLRHKDKLAKVYKQRNFKPLWSSSGQYTNTCRALVKKLGDSSLMGLHPSRYYTQILDSWLHHQEPQTTRNLELVLTDALFEYLDNLANGQTGKRPGDSESWFAKQSVTKTDDYGFQWFQGNTSFRQTINQLQPESQHYNNLLLALGDHHAILAKGGYVKIPEGKTLKPGMQDARVLELRQRLTQSSDYLDNFTTNSIRYDSYTEESLKAFQTRHGLEADGILGQKTLKELNTSVEERIAQIEINLDRWRWLPKNLGENHIIVNTAGFQMELVLNGYNVLDMNVVVGKPEHKTPIFSKDMDHMVFNPSWNVPKSIATKKLLPKEIANPGYLQNENFVAVSRTDQSTRPIDSFASYELEPSNFNSRFRLKQLPGSNNALGTVKFMLPNQYAIYLHDTNSRNLFQETTRAYSHGCIRVEDPVTLAKVLLMNEGHSEHSVEERFTSKQSKGIRLDNPLPVHMTYQTAWVDQNGILNFRKDIYDHDAKTIQNYQHKQQSPAQIERHLLTQLGIVANNDI